MADYARLSLFDRALVDVEDRATHMHVAATCIFDATPLGRPNGAIDIERIRRYVHGRLNTIPRYRQRLAYVPFERHPVWVDDYRFDLRFHVRHVGLPKPGDEKQLKRLLGWILSQQLDRDRPLWEMWIIEGIEGNRFAVCQKVHHCMIDGLAGVEEMAVLLDLDPNAGVDIPRRWQPREAPSSLELVRDAISRRLATPATLATSALNVLRRPVERVHAIRNAATGLGSLIGDALRPCSVTPLNRAIGGQRRFDWTSFDLEAIKGVKNALGGTINDVVLATVAGALRSFFVDSGLTASDLGELRMRAMCPVNGRSAADHSRVGNNVAGMLVDLPVAAGDPLGRFHAVRAATVRAKGLHYSDGSLALVSLCDWIAPSLLPVIERTAMRSRLFNIVVTNIPGPPLPLYMLGARMLETFPLVPIFAQQGLGIAVFSYCGRLFWGFNTDRDVVPEPRQLVEAVEASFAELAAAAGVELLATPSIEIEERHAPEAAQAN